MTHPLIFSCFIVICFIFLVALLAFIESRAFQINNVQIDLRENKQAGKKNNCNNSNVIKILQISDTHFTKNQKKKEKFVQSLKKYRVDFVVQTGDCIATKKGLESYKRSISQLLKNKGVFVLGSNDLVKAKFKNPLIYLWKKKPKLLQANMPTKELVDYMVKGGWKNLNNQSYFYLPNSKDGIKPNYAIEFLGLADPHTNLDNPQMLSSSILNNSKSESVKKTLKIGIVHAPYIRDIVFLANQGADVIFAGHTHGGQISKPIVNSQKALEYNANSIVSNCDIPQKFAYGKSTVFQVLSSVSKFETRKEPTIKNYQDIFPLHIKKQLSSNKNQSQQKSVNRYEKISNLKKPKKNSTLYITKGIGTSPYAPFRLFTKPSADLITILF